MIQDPEALAHLAAVREHWLNEGPLGTLLALTATVWGTNLRRYEPERLGDDQLVLGIQCSRNLCNLTVEALRGVTGTKARDRQTLEISFGGQMLHVNKAPAPSSLWNIWSMDWRTSDVREEAARLNSAAYQSDHGTLFAGLPKRLKGDVDQLRHLHCTWQGLPDGEVRHWLGFPRTGDRPWFAVVELDPPGDMGRGGQPATGTEPPSSSPQFDALAEPTVRVTRRPRPAVS